MSASPVVWFSKTRAYGNNARGALSTPAILDLGFGLGGFEGTHKEEHEKELEDQRNGDILDTAVVNASSPGINGEATDDGRVSNAARGTDVGGDGTINGMDNRCGNVPSSDGVDNDAMHSGSGLNGSVSGIDRGGSSGIVDGSGDGIDSGSGVGIDNGNSIINASSNRIDGGSGNGVGSATNGGNAIGSNSSLYASGSGHNSDNSFDAVRGGLRGNGIDNGSGIDYQRDPCAPVDPDVRISSRPRLESVEEGKVSSLTRETHQEEKEEKDTHVNDRLKDRVDLVIERETKQEEGIEDRKGNKEKEKETQPENPTIESASIPIIVTNTTSLSPPSGLTLRKRPQSQQVRFREHAYVSFPKQISHFMLLCLTSLLAIRLILMLSSLSFLCCSFFFFSFFFFFFIHLLFISLSLSLFCFVFYPFYTLFLHMSFFFSNPAKTTVTEQEGALREREQGAGKEEDERGESEGDNGKEGMDINHPRPLRCPCPCQRLCEGAFCGLSRLD